MDTTLPPPMSPKDVAESSGPKTEPKPFDLSASSDTTFIRQNVSTQIPRFAKHSVVTVQTNPTKAGNSKYFVWLLLICILSGAAIGAIGTLITLYMRGASHSETTIQP